MGTRSRWSAAAAACFLAAMACAAEPPALLPASDPPPAAVPPTVLELPPPPPSPSDVPPKHAALHEAMDGALERHKERAEEIGTGGGYTTAELILMTPHSRLLDYAIVDPRDDLAPEGRVANLNYRTQPGIRVGVGYRLPDAPWDFGFAYTYLSSVDQGTVFAPAGGLIYPTLTRPTIVTEAAAATARARLDYNLYDMTAGRTFRTDDGFAGRLYGGLRFASIHQGLESYANGLLADFSYVRSRSDFDGAGPVFGGEGSWAVGKHLGVYVRGSTGLVTGTVRSPLYEANNSGLTVLADVSNRADKTVPFLSLGIGLSWQYRGFWVRAGYDVTNWFNLTEQTRFVDSFAEGKMTTRSADLALDGFFLQFGMEF